MEDHEMSLRAKLKFLAVAGVGFFADGYLNISIGLVVPMIGYIYFKDSKNALPTNGGDAIKGGLAAGMILGQLIFGCLGDALGRHRVYGKELLFTIFGTLMCILLPWEGISQQGVIAWMTCWRIFTGIGIGGDYPMSSSLAAEKSPLGSRAVNVLTVFSCIGLGSFVSGIVLIVLTAAFQGAIEQDINNVQWVWRLYMGIGLIPCALTLYARWVMNETKPYEKYVMKKDGSSSGPGATRTLSDQFHDFRIYFSEWKHAKALFSVCAVWFLFDIAYYGVNLNQAVILSKIGFGTGKTPYLTLWHTALGNMIVQGAGYLPGFYLGIFLPDWMGRKKQQLILSLTVAVIYAIWAGVTNKANVGGLMLLFTVSQLVLNAGPNSTTFLLPAELFPTRVRGSAHGLAAASGKAGALLTSFAFGKVTAALGIQGVLGLFSGVMVLAAALTLLIPESRDVTLEGLEKDVLFKTLTVSSMEDSHVETIDQTMVTKGSGDSV